MGNLGWSGLIAAIRSSESRVRCGCHARVSWNGCGWTATHVVKPSLFQDWVKWCSHVCILKLFVVRPHPAHHAFYPTIPCFWGASQNLCKNVFHFSWTSTQYERLWVNLVANLCGPRTISKHGTDMYIHTWCVCDHVTMQTWISYICGSSCVGALCSRCIWHSRSISRPLGIQFL